MRFVTYNILADQYTSQEYSQKVLFGYCPTRCPPLQYTSVIVKCLMSGTAGLLL